MGLKKWISGEKRNCSENDAKKINEENKGAFSLEKGISTYFAKHEIERKKKGGFSGETLKRKEEVFS